MSGNRSGGKAEDRERRVVQIKQQTWEETSEKLAAQLSFSPTPDRLRRLLHTALHQFDEQFCASICLLLCQSSG